MSRRTTTLGLALLAGLLMSIAIAPAARASFFTAASYPATISGEQTTKLELKTEAGTLKCGSATFSGEQSGATEALTLTPTYKECTVGSTAATVTMVGCDYLLHAGEEVKADEVKGTFEVKCPEGKEIDVDFAEVNCAIHIQAQSGLSSVTYSSKTEAGDFDASLSLSGLKYSLTGTKTGCGHETGSFTNGTLNGAATVKGTHEGKATNLSVMAKTPPSGLLTMPDKELVPEGTEINLVAGKGTEHELRLETALGTIECGEVELFGEVTLNNGEEFRGESNAEKEGRTSECVIEPSERPFTVTSPSFTLKSTETGSGLIGLTFIAHLEFSPGNVATCHFFTGEETTEPPASPETTGVFHYEVGSSTVELTPTLLESPECGEAEIEGSFTVETPDGTPVALE